MEENEKKYVKKEQKVFRRDPYWPGVLFQLYIHANFLYSLVFIPQAKLLTHSFAIFLIATSLLGTTAGAHRLWAHRSYSANLILRIILMLCQTLVGYSSIYDWVLDHRIHHKYHGTDDDPYNYKRGFIYAQIGNYMLVKNPKRDQLVKEIDMSDLEQDKVVMFQKRFFWILMPILNVILTINAPAEYWGESLLVSLLIIGGLRVTIALHASWLVNSARCVWGLVPDDRFFSDSNLAYILKKSHWHEYHYTIPWDCLTNEFGSYNCGCSTIFIKIWAAMGWAYNLRTIDARGIRMGLKRAIDTGKPIDKCINEVAEELEQYQPEDKLTELLQYTVKQLKNMPVAGSFHVRGNVGLPSSHTKLPIQDYNHQCHDLFFSIRDNQAELLPNMTKAIFISRNNTKQ